MASRDRTALLAAALLAALLAACAPAVVADEPGRNKRRVPFAGNAVHVGDACVSKLKPAAAYGLAARVAEKLLPDGSISLQITNHGETERRVRLHRVHVDFGPCERAPFATYSEHPFGAWTHEAPHETVLAPHGSFELRIEPSQVDAWGSCSKYVLGLIFRVDDAYACLEAGTWIIAEER